VDPVTGLEKDPFEPVILGIETPNHDMYNEKPIEFSAYLQDKIEFKQMIVNIGLRFDYFDSRGKILADPSDPNIYSPFKLENVFNDLNGDGRWQPGEDSLTLADREAYWWKDASPKYQLSPRFGIAYPITDKGVIHFSYGHFLQIPSFLYLYNDPGFKVSTSGNVQGPYGNADLEPQKTVMYELGLQQQLFADIGVDITGFYRDVRNWVTTSASINTEIPGVAYTIYINRDYANVRGITVSVNKRQSNYYSFNVDYTFQVAEGSNSDPSEEFFAVQDNAEPTRAIMPLDWDQSHTLNASFILGVKNWSVGIIGRYGSGFPYSPAINTATRQGRNLSTGLNKNSRRKPTTYTVDLRVYKSFKLGSLNLSLFAKVFNLFDTRNEVDVFTYTGRATYTTEGTGRYFNRPDYFSEPREIQVGFEMDF